MSDKELNNAAAKQQRLVVKNKKYIDKEGKLI